MENFLKVSNFDKIEADSENIQPLNSELVEILMNSS
jgi:hypothetical protein